eukprot:4470651-Prymnesium_polylepis.1
MFGKGNEDGVLPIIAISICWATPAHPDPDGTQLRKIVKVLESEMQKYSTGLGGATGLGETEGKGFKDMGIFWDVRRPRAKLAQTKAF